MAVRQTLKNLFQRRGEVEKGLQNLNDIETIHTEIKHKVDELAKKAIELQQQVTKIVTVSGDGNQTIKRLNHHDNQLINNWDSNQQNHQSIMVRIIKL